MISRLTHVLTACVFLCGCTSTSNMTVDDLFSDTMRELDSQGKPVKSGPANSRLLAANARQPKRRLRRLSAKAPAPMSLQGRR